MAWVGGASQTIGAHEMNEMALFALVRCGYAFLFERYHAFVENGTNVRTTHHLPAPPLHYESVPQAQALRPTISMYESATEHTKSLVLTASVQRSQRAAELNRRSCVGESIIVLYRTKRLGGRKGTRRFRLGRRRESTRLTLESILQAAKPPSLR